MGDRLNQHLQRKFTLQDSDRNSQTPGQRANRQFHEVDGSGGENIKESTCLDDRGLERGAQAPSYQSIIKFLGLLAGCLSLLFSLPLCLIIRSRSDSADQSFLGSLSIFCIISSAFLEWLAYISLLAFLLHLGLLILLSFKLKDIQVRINHKQKWPTNYALFLRIPSLQLHKEQVCQEIEAWFRREQKLNRSFADLFSELCPSLNQQQLSEMDSSVESQFEGNAKKLQSRIVEAVHLSFNYEQFVKMSQEVSAVDDFIKNSNTEINPTDIQALINLYNKKKNILTLIPINQYCLVLFKNERYCRYFYQRTKGNILSKFFCVEKFSDFQIRQQSVQMIQGLLPNEIYWKNLHHKRCSLIKKRLSFFIVWFLFTSAGIGLQFVLIYMQVNNPVSALLINVFVFFSAKILMRLHREQPYAYYSQQKKAIVAQLSILNLVDLVFGPLVISYLISPALLSDSSQFILYQLLSLLCFMGFSITDRLLNALCQDAKEAQADGFFKPDFQSQLISNLTVLSMTYFLAPMFPLVIIVAFVWFIAMYIMHKFINLARNEDHGGKLLYSMLKYLHRSIFCLIVGTCVVYSFTAIQLIISWPLSAIIIVCLLSIFAFILQMIDFGFLRQCSANKKPAELKGKLLDGSYASAKPSFVMLYQQFNFALSDTLKATAHGCSARMKIYEQLNTMSKTLTLSLKERLFNNINPIISNEKRLQQPEEDVNDIYFQYERKVTMKKVNPKIAIPPLFKKEDSIDPGPQESNAVQMMNFNSIFSSDDKEARKMLKRHIKRKLGDNAVNN